MDRANAAQLASRNIKQAKGRRKQPIRSDSPSQQSMSFQGGSDGGLFGGSVQAPGTFNFAASGGPSFPPSSFGNPFSGVSSPDVSENEDPRADTTGEEAARRKKPFREESNSSFQTSNSFGQAPFGQSQQNPTNSPFSFSSPQASTSGVFNHNHNQAPTNTFSFGATRPSAASSGMDFGSAPSQNQVSSNIFGGFGQSTTQAPTSSAFSFGSSAAQDKPVNPNFFNPSTTQPPISANNSGSANMFGNSVSVPPPMSNVYGDKEQTSGATVNPFGGRTVFGSSQTPAKADEGQTPRPTSIFASPNNPSSTAQPLANNNMFGTPGDFEPPVSSRVFSNFSEPPTAPAQATTSSGAPSIPAPSEPLSTNMFGTPAVSQAPDSSGIVSAFTKSSDPNTQSSNSNIFGTPSTAQAPTNNIFGTSSISQPLSSSTLFGTPKTSQPPAPSNVFSTFGKPTDATTQPATSSSVFNPFGKSFDTTTPPSTSNVFAAAENSFGTMSGDHSSQGGVLDTLNKQEQPAANLFGSLNKPVDEAVAQPKASDILSNGVGAIGASSTIEVQTPSIGSQAPTGNFFGTPKPLFPAPSSPSEALGAHSNTPFSFGSTSDAMKANGASSSLTKSIGLTTNGNLALSTTSLSQSSNAASAPSFSDGPLNGSLTERVDNGKLLDKNSPTDEYLHTIVPQYYNEQQKREFFTAYRLRSLNKTIAEFLSSAPVGVEISSVITYFNQKRSEILDRSSKPVNGSKRKAADEIDAGDESRNKRTKPFDSIDSPAQNLSDSELRPASPEKRPPAYPQNQLHIKGLQTPTSAPFPPTSSVLSEAAPAPSPSPQSKRKATEELTKDIFEQGSTRLKMDGSATSNMFKNIIDNDASPGKKVKPLPNTLKEEQPRANPFGNLPLTSSQTPGATSTAFTPTNRFAPQSTATTSNMFLAKSPATVNTFAPKINAASSSTSSSTSKGVITPPNFGSSNGPVNFLAQFGQQAAKDAVNSERDLMEKDKAEDYDSDDDGPVEVWEANWKAARKVKLTQLAEDVRSNRTRPFFVPGKGFSLTSAEKLGAAVSAHHSKPEGANLDVTKAAVSDPGTPKSIFDSVQNSRAPSPSTDGPGAFSNPFAHLASTSAAAGKDDDTDDESGDEDVDGDSENKDPSRQLGKENNGSHTTVQGIAKKAPLFSFGQKAGLSDPSRTFGTSAPLSGGLFDRVQKDTNGNPIRQVPSDEKENAEPNTTNTLNQNLSGTPFGKMSEGPIDQTWKKDSPIRFGNAAQSNETVNPIVNVTAATPTKAPAPFSNLFGNSTTPKAALASPTVGFNFSAPLSGLSSLLPSTAVSESTSRATTPGATTDGDSAAEGDPGMEKHDQINLTAGGPGEEDEDVLYEVRARASVFIPAKSQFVTQGVGLLRVLKNTETNASRVLLRADPSGKIVLNKAIILQTYEAVKKTVSFFAAPDKGEGLEKWILQVKAENMAEELAKVLESNKP